MRIQFILTCMVIMIQCQIHQSFYSIPTYFTNVGIVSHNDLPGTTPLAEGLV